LVGITSIALANAGWAADHGGGGGGFGGGFDGGGFRRGGFSGGRVGSVVGSRGGGVGFGMPQFHSGVPHSVIAGPRFSGRTGTLPIRPHAFSGPERTPTNQSAPSNIVRNSSAIPSATRQSQTFPQRGLNGRTDHIFARHDGNWHPDWDRRHAHFHNGHFFVFIDGFWCGLDAGFFPWDYLPYYAYDYYPYDYYADVQPYDDTGAVYNDVPAADTTVQAVQIQLSQLGYYTGPVDGIFGPATRDAVAKYQIANQLTVTGSLSPDTLQSLGLPQVTPS